MDASSLFSGAGATGVVGVVLFIVYRLLTKSHCRSKCCGKEVTVDMSENTPTRDAPAAAEHVTEKPPTVVVPPV